MSPRRINNVEVKRTAQGVEMGPAPRVMTDTTPRMGRSSYEVECPHCTGWVTVYCWAFGSGKKCLCGAILYPSWSLSPDNYKEERRLRAAAKKALKFQEPSR